MVIALKLTRVGNSVGATLPKEALADGTLPEADLAAWLRACCPAV